MSDMAINHTQANSIYSLGILSFFQKKTPDSVGGMNFGQGFAVYTRSRFR
ncbi:MAG: hypothetical protein HC775_20535 [Hyellaceae cyanobacterium CSU_1_1]|nr:hypothetical protein [Pleurocapsa sp. CRU_1_2]NJR47905.1 hypothetical protein [Hyellaceae cyanobacterium CSU_1_1]